MHVGSYWPAEAALVSEFLASLGCEFTQTIVTDSRDGAQWVDIALQGDADLLPVQGHAAESIAAVEATVERKRRQAKHAKRQELAAAQANLPMDTIRPFHTPGCCGHVDMVIPHGEGQVLCYTGPRTAE